MGVFVGLGVLVGLGVFVGAGVFVALGFASAFSCFTIVEKLTLIPLFTRKVALPPLKTPLSVIFTFTLLSPLLEAEHLDCPETFPTDPLNMILAVMDLRSLPPLTFTNTRLVPSAISDALAETDASALELMPDKGAKINNIQINAAKSTAAAFLFLLPI